MHHIFYDFFGWNKIIFILINQLTNVSIIPSILKLISNLFFIGSFPIYFFAICLYCYFYLKEDSSLKLNQVSHEKQFNSIYNALTKAGLGYTLFGFLYAAIKFSINLARPFCSLDPKEFITIINIDNERCLSSFPSAHTGLAILIFYYLWPYFKTYQKVLAILIIIIVALSRITLAMHYPADIFYSIIIVFIVIYISNILFFLLYLKLIKPIERFVYKLLF